MIEEKASVISVAGKQIWVQTQRKSVCGSCSVQKGCGTASLEQLFGRKRTQLLVSSNLPVNAGDEVLLGIEESTLLRGSMLLYGIPLVFMLSGAILVQSLLPEGGELPVIAAAITSLLLGLFLVAGYSKKLRFNPMYHPTVLKVIRPSSHQSNGIFAP